MQLRAAALIGICLEILFSGCNLRSDVPKRKSGSGTSGTTSTTTSSTATSTTATTTSTTTTTSTAGTTTSGTTTSGTTGETTSGTTSGSEPDSPPKDNRIFGVQTRAFAGACIGGSRCGGAIHKISFPTRVTLSEIRFMADDLVAGGSQGAKINVFYDDIPAASYLKLNDKAQTYRYTVANRLIRSVSFESANGKSARIMWVELQVDDDAGIPKTEPFGDEITDNLGLVCLGGAECPKGADSSVRVFSILPYGEIHNIVLAGHDNVGELHQGKVDIYCDSKLMAGKIDIYATGTLFNVEGKNAVCSHLAFIPNFDEVKFKYIKVVYVKHKNL